MLVDNLRLDIAANAENMAKLQDQIASGKRLRSPSDDPQSVSRALTLSSASRQNAQYLRNIDAAKGWMEATDAALDQLSSVLTRARDAALRGGNDILGSDERRALARQVDSLLEEAQQTVNSTYEGKYLFAGRLVTGSKPVDITRVPIYGGDSGEIQVEVSQGVQIAMNLPGDVTAGGSGGVLEQGLTSLKQLRDQLDAGNRVEPAQLDPISDCIDRIVQLRGVVGARMNRLDATESILNDQQTTLAAALSRAQDADVAEVMTKLMTQETVYRAALAAGARVIQPSLLDFLG